MTVLYNGMIAPLRPFPIKGAIWYQGESNAGRAAQYRRLLPTMIRDWRAQFEVGDFPFFIVQLANFMERQAEPGDSAWAELREAQFLTTKALPNVGRRAGDRHRRRRRHPPDEQAGGRPPAGAGRPGDRLRQGRRVLRPGLQGDGDPRGTPSG